MKHQQRIRLEKMRDIPDLYLDLAVQVSTIVELVKDHLGITDLPEPGVSEGKFPPVLKIRGLLHRDGNKLKKVQDGN